MCCYFVKLSDFQYQKNMRSNNKNALPLTSGFTQAGVYARRQFCWNLEVYRLPEPLCSRLRETATTLAAIAGQRAGEQTSRLSYISENKSNIILINIMSNIN